MPDFLSHDAWQAQIVDLAHIYGWSHLHVRRTIGRGKRWTTSTNVIGWPDLFLWHPRHGFAAFELKVNRDKPTPQQLAVLAELEQAGARVAVLHGPSDFDKALKMLSTAVPQASLPGT